MQLDLTRYHQGINHFSRTFRPDEVEQDGEAYRIVEPVHLDVQIHKDKERFRIVGAATTRLELGCSRCLDPFTVPIDSAFDLRYSPAEAEADASSRGDDREVSEDDLDGSVYRDDQIDLNELLREQFYLALPMKPLCRDDCAGLCPQCGTNRNTGTCACVSQWEDPRLAPLKRLK
jgi:DUF177 domain-containing protein